MKKILLETLSKYWGYTSFRPFQEKAIQSILDSRDTFTVLPTGGGKSICFQLPALIAPGMAVIVSPLISLMKDQVDFLKDIGVGAEYLNSSLNSSAYIEIINKIHSGKVKLLYISPEKLVTPQVLELLSKIRLSFFVIDEAHCISHWGHNFREEYRQLGLIKEQFRNVNIHAFTATATPEVQKDVVEQLNLKDPHLYIGSVDRPNLTYRIFPRSHSLLNDVTGVLKKHGSEPGIIYCLRRSDVDELSLKLSGMGYNNRPYHAGLSDDLRKRNQDEFSKEEVPLMVATIAFGMGIDRSNIRFIIHAAMPKSLEHYQQETGRAGRDGLPAECYMFFSGSDYKTWEYMFRDSSEQEVMLQKLRVLYGFCSRPSCRHRAISNYFGQEYGQSNCEACDYCLGELAMVNEPLIVAQKILSCVLRVKEKFGAEHVANILRGAVTESIAKWGHASLSTFGLLQGETKQFVRSMIEQLLGQGFLEREPEFSTLMLTEEGHKLLRGEMVPILARPPEKSEKQKSEIQRKAKRKGDWEGVDEKLFEILRRKRAELARAKGVPAFIIFGDMTLMDMAKIKPLSKDEFADVYGVGEFKLQQYSMPFINVIIEYQKQSQ